MSQRSFSAQVSAWVQKTERRMLAVFQTAAQFVIEDMMDRTRVDTGFLRASITVSTDGPAPMSRPLPPGSVKGQYQHDEHYTMVIAGAAIGGTIWVTYAANYAAYREFGTHGHPGDGMVRLSAQSWPLHVKKAVAQVKAEVGN